MLGACGLGFYVTQRDFGAVVPIILAFTLMIIVRFTLKRPFYESLTLYMAIAAFNYYYFYCSRLTGRNPTDVPGVGMPATDLERMQKDIIFGIMLLLASIKMFSIKMQGKSIWLKRITHPLLRITVFYVVYSILRSFFVVFQGGSPFNAMVYVRVNAEYALIPFLMLSTLITEEKQLQVIFRGMLYTLPLVALLGIIEFFIQGSPYIRSFSAGQTFYRATSTLQNPNNLGGYLGTVMGVYVIYFIKQKLGGMEKTMFFPAMGLGMACLFMTLSRSSILTFLILVSATIFIFLYAQSKRLKKQKYKLAKNIIGFYGVVLLISLFVLYKFFDFSNALSDGLSLYGSGESSTGSGRIFALFVYLFPVISNPLRALFGYGVGLFSGIDNAFAYNLVENGLVGFGLYISIWFISFKVCLKRILDKNREYSYLYLVCFYILGYQALYGCTAPININFPHNLYFWFTVGVLGWMETPFQDPSMQAISEEKSRSEQMTARS